MQAARVRRAIQALQQAMETEEVRKRKALAGDDLDDPIPQEDLDQLCSSSWRRHRCRSPPGVEPADSLISRLYKEMTKRVLQVKCVWSTKTRKHNIKGTLKKQKIGDKLTLTHENEEEEESVVHDVQTYLAKLWTLLLAYARAGIRKLPTAPNEEKADTPTHDFIEAPLDLMVAYYERAKEKTLALPPRRQLAFLQQRDEEERTQWVDAYRHSIRGLGQCIFEVFHRRQALWEVQLDGQAPRQANLADADYSSSEQIGADTSAAALQDGSPPV